MERNGDSMALKKQSEAEAIANKIKGFDFINTDEVVIKKGRLVEPAKACHAASIKIVGDRLRVNGKNITIEELETYEWGGFKFNTIDTLFEQLLVDLGSADAMYNSAYSKIGVGKSTYAYMPSKVLEAELMEVYGCSEDELPAYVLSDLYKFKTTDTFIKYIGTLTIKIEGRFPLWAYLLVLTKYPLHFYKVAYSIQPMLLDTTIGWIKKGMEIQRTCTTVCNDDARIRGEHKAVFKAFTELTSSDVLAEVLKLAWVTKIGHIIKLDKLEQADEILEESLSYKEYWSENTTMYKYLTGEIDITQYVKEVVSCKNTLPLVRLRSILDSSTPETKVQSEKLILGLKEADVKTFNRILSGFRCSNRMTLENAVMWLIETKGDKLFKSQYKGLFEANKKLQAELNESNDKLNNVDKAWVKERRGLLNSKEKLENSLKSKEREVEKLKEINNTVKVSDYSNSEVESLKGKLDEAQTSLEGLEVELNTRVNKLNLVTAENEKLKGILKYYGIKANENIGNSDDEALCTSQYIEDDGVTIEEKIKTINTFKIAICGGVPSLIRRVVDRGIVEIKHISSISDCQRNGQFDLYILVTDFISHKIRWQIETRISEEGSHMVYFSGTNIDNMINVMYNTLIK